MKRNKITLKLLFDYNFSDNFNMPELTEDDKNSLYWASQYANDNFFPANGKTRQYWTLKDKNYFCKFAKDNI